MPVSKLTGAVIGKLKPAEDGKRLNYFDSQHKGLCLRVGGRDKTWAYHYRFNGKSRSPALGKYAPSRIDHMDREAAIAAANEIDKLVGKGIDPKQANAAPKPKPKPTTESPNAFKSRVRQYLKLYKSEVKPATYYQGKRILNGVYVQPLNETDVSKITRVQLVELLEDMDETPAMANRLHAYLSKFFNWCWDRGYVDPSPMAGLKKRFKEKARKRHLNGDEIKKLWSACLDLGYPLGDWCRFTLATGQRPGECRNLNRDDLHNGVWLVEGGDPKNEERHRIPLPSIAREIIKNAPEFTGGYVFTTTAGKKPITQGGKPYGELYKAVEIEKDWRPHDLRRTFQTIASEELDVEPYLLGAICNQLSVAKPGVASTYNQAKWMKPKKEALQAWNDYLKKLIKEKHQEEC